MRSPHPHIAFMSRVRRTTRGLDDDRQTWRVVDDLPRVDCIDAAELDAVEAFLMPQLNAILSGNTTGVERRATALRPDSQAPQYPALERVARG
jgi:hypothetical protein